MNPHSVTVRVYDNDSVRTTAADYWHGRATTTHHDVLDAVLDWAVAYRVYDVGTPNSLHVVGEGVGLPTALSEARTRNDVTVAEHSTDPTTVTTNE